MHHLSYAEALALRAAIADDESLLAKAAEFGVSEARTAKLRERIREQKVALRAGEA